MKKSALIAIIAFIVAAIALFVSITCYFYRKRELFGCGCDCDDCDDDTFDTDLEFCGEDEENADSSAESETQN